MYSLSCFNQLRNPETAKNYDWQNNKIIKKNCNNKCNYENNDCAWEKRKKYGQTKLYRWMGCSKFILRMEVILSNGA